MAASAIRDELDRRDKIAALDSYLQELDAVLGPVPNDEREAARRWADRALGDERRPADGGARRTA